MMSLSLNIGGKTSNTYNVLDFKMCDNLGIENVIICTFLNVNLLRKHNFCLGDYKF